MAPTEFDTPNIPASQAVVILHSKVFIDAPAGVVFRNLRNTDTWRDWNRFVPKVTITFQPPEQDTVTNAEIAELVRNTSIIGSFDSDLTDGGYGVRKQRSPDEQPPPRFRLNSVSSQMSGMSGNGQPRVSDVGVEGRPSTSSNRNGSSTLNPPGSPLAVMSADRKASAASMTSSVDSNQSGAQKFQAAQEARKASIAAGETPAAVNNNLAAPLPLWAQKNTGLSDAERRRSSAAQKADSAAAKARVKTQMNLINLYGEPSVRLQLNTKMTFHVMMKPEQPRNLTETHLIVTEVSRPDDPILEGGTTQLNRSTTHTLDATGTYRVVWANDNAGASMFNLSNIFSGSKLPKSILQAERVHEIVPIIDEHGNQTCTYGTWECQKGPGAKYVKKKYEAYLQKMFGVWTEGLKNYCEGLHAPKIERRDFSVDMQAPPILKEPEPEA